VWNNSDFFRKVNDEKLPPVDGYIVFTEDSFKENYSELSRTYRVNSNNKAFQSDMIGSSIFASCLDGTDISLRLDGYLRGENAWKIERCYVYKRYYDMVG
jgi:hypothetical protein